MGVQLPEKKHYVTLEWSLSHSIVYRINRRYDFINENHYHPSFCVMLQWPWSYRATHVLLAYYSVVQYLASSTNSCAHRQRQDKTILHSTNKYELQSFQLPYIIKQKPKIIIMKILKQLNNYYIYESII